MATKRKTKADLIKENNSLKRELLRFRRQEGLPLMIAGFSIESVCELISRHKKELEEIARSYYDDDKDRIA